MAEASTITLFSMQNDEYRLTNTAVIFGVTRGGTSMVAGAVRGFGYHLGPNLLVNQEDTNFYYKTDEHMKDVIRERNLEYQFWGWKYPMAAEYVERLMSELRNPIFIIVSRDAVATATSLIRWDDRDASGAIAETAIQLQKNLMLAIRLRVPTLFVSYEKASLHRDAFLDELGSFLERPLTVERDKLLNFMSAGTYKSYEMIVLTENCRSDEEDDSH
jgi:hypothetical protein